MGKILVTGGSGLVGRCFSEPEFDRISSKHGDLRDPEFVSRLMTYSQYEGVIHCAARVGRIAGNMNHQGLYFYDNIMMNTLLIEEARKKGIQKMVIYSSTCVFPDKVIILSLPKKFILDHLIPQIMLMLMLRGWE